MSDRWVRAASPEEIPPGQLHRVRIDGEEIVIANVEGDLYALEDLCSHEDLPLSDGILEGDRLECVYHGAEFDVCTGKALRLPAIGPVRTFETELREDGVYLKVE